jgi:hypothetical protein
VERKTLPLPGDRMFSFSTRKKSVDFQRYIRRLIDRTSPNRGGSASMERYENRHNRIIPALLCPWDQNTPIVSKAVVAITKDFSDRGIGLILSNTFDAEYVVVGFCHEEATAKEPLFFLGVKRTSSPIGGGFWLFGVELAEFMNETWRAELEPLFPMAKKLLQPSCPIFEDQVAVESPINQAIEW